MTPNERLEAIKEQASELMGQVNTINVLIELMENAVSDIGQTADEINHNIKWYAEDLERSRG